MVDVFSPGYKSRLTGSDPTVDALADTLSGLGDDALNALDAVVTGAGKAIEGVVSPPRPTPVAPRSVNADIDKTYQPKPDLDGQQFVPRSNVVAPDWMVPELAKAVPVGKSQFERTGAYFRESPAVAADVKKRVEATPGYQPPTPPPVVAPDIFGLAQLMGHALTPKPVTDTAAMDRTEEPEAGNFMSRLAKTLHEAPDTLANVAPMRMGEGRPLPMVIGAGQQPPVVDITSIAKAQPEATPQDIANMLMEHEGQSLLTPEQARKQATEATKGELVAGGGTINQIFGKNIPWLGEVPLNPGAVFTGVAQHMGRGEKGQDQGILATLANALMGGDDNIRPGELSQEGGTPLAAFELGRAGPRMVGAFGDAGGEALAELAGYKPPPEYMPAEQAMAEADLRRRAFKSGREWGGMPERGAEAEPSTQWLSDALEGLGNFGGNVADIAHGLATIPTGVREALTNKPTSAAQMQSIVTLASDFAREGFVKPLMAAFWSAPVIPSWIDPQLAAWGRKVAREHPLDVFMAASAVPKVVTSLRKVAADAYRAARPAAEKAIRTAEAIAPKEPGVMATVAKGFKLARDAMFEGPTVAAYDLLSSAITLIGFEMNGVARPGELAAMARQWLMSPSQFTPAAIRNFLVQVRNTGHSIDELFHKALKGLTEEQAVAVDRAMSGEAPENAVPLTEFGSVPGGARLEAPGVSEARGAEQAKPSFVVGAEASSLDKPWLGTVTDAHRVTLGQTKAVGRLFDDVVKVTHPQFRDALKREWDALPESPVAGNVEQLFSDAPATSTRMEQWGADKRGRPDPNAPIQHQFVDVPGGKADITTAMITEEPVDLGEAMPFDTAVKRLEGAESERTDADLVRSSAAASLPTAKGQVTKAREVRDERSVFSALVHAINSAKYAMRKIDPQAPTAAADYKRVADRLQRTADAHKIVLPLVKTQRARLSAMERELPKAKDAAFGGRNDLEAAYKDRADATKELARLRYEETQAKVLGGRVPDLEVRRAAAKRKYDEATGRLGVNDAKAAVQEVRDLIEAMGEEVATLGEVVGGLRQERGKVARQFGKDGVDLNDFRSTPKQEAADLARETKRREREAANLRKQIERQEALAAQHDARAATPSVTPEDAAKHKAAAQAARDAAAEARDALAETHLRRARVDVDRSAYPTQEVRREYAEQPRVVLDRIVRRLAGETDEMAVAHAIAEEGLNPDMLIDVTPDLPHAPSKGKRTLAGAIIDEMHRARLGDRSGRATVLDRIARDLEAKAPESGPLMSQAPDSAAWTPPEPHPRPKREDVLESPDEVTGAPTRTPRADNPLMGLDVREALGRESRAAEPGDYTQGPLPVDVVADIVRTPGKAQDIQVALAQRGVLVTPAQVGDAMRFKGMENPRAREASPEGIKQVGDTLSPLPTDTRINAPLKSGKTPAERIAELKGLGRSPEQIHAALWAEGWKRPEHPNKRVRADMVAEQRRWVEDVYAGREGVLTPGKEYGQPDDLKAGEAFATREPPPPATPVDADLPRLTEAEAAEVAARLSPEDVKLREAYKRVAAQERDGRVNGLTVTDEGDVVVNPDVRLLLENAAKQDGIPGADARRRLAALEANAGAALPGKQALKAWMAITREARELGNDAISPEGAAELARIDAEIRQKELDLAEAALPVAVWDAKRAASHKAGVENAHVADEKYDAAVRLRQQIEAEIASLREQRKPHLRSPLFYDTSKLPDVYSPDVYTDPGAIVGTLDKWMQSYVDGLLRGRDAELAAKVAEARERLSGKTDLVKQMARDAANPAERITTQGAKTGPLMRNQLKALGIPLDVRNELGRVQDVRVTLPHRAQQLAKSIATFNMATKLVAESGNPSDWRLRVMTKDEFQALPANQRSQWTLMPEDAMGYHQNGNPWATKKWGDLAGKFVHSDVYYQLVAMERMAESIPFLTSLVNLGKSAKTIYNPAGHMRNLWANVFVFAPLMGINPFNPGNWRFYTQALKDLTLGSKSPWFWESYRSGTIDPNFTGAELSMRGSHAVANGLFGEMGDFWKNVKIALKGPSERHGSAFSAAAKPLSQAHEGLGVTYQFMDDIFRQAAWLKEMEQRGFATPLREGETPDQARVDAANAAAESVRNGTVNYTDTSRLIQTIAKPHANPGTMGAKVGQAAAWSALYGKPFFTFQGKAVPVIVEGVRKRPMEFAMFQAAGDAINYALALDAGISREELDAVMLNRPKRYRNARLSGIGRDDQGKPTLRLRDYSEANVGFGDLDVLGEVREKSVMDTLGGMVANNFIGSPFKTLLTGKTPLGAKAWDEATVGADDNSVSRFLRAAVQNFAPMAYPSGALEGTPFESYATGQMRSAEQGVPDAQGRQHSPSEVFWRFAAGDKSTTEPWSDMVVSGVQDFAQEMAHDASAIDRKYLQPLRLEKAYRDQIAEVAPGGYVAEQQRAMENEARVNLYALIDKYGRRLKNVPVEVEGVPLLTYLANAKDALDTGEWPVKEVRKFLMDATKDALGPARMERALRYLDTPSAHERNVGDFLSDVYRALPGGQPPAGE